VIFCRQCLASSEQEIVNMRTNIGNVLCQSCYEKGLDEWAESNKED
jgi:hypothetical protein